MKCKDVQVRYEQMSEEFLKKCKECEKVQEKKLIIEEEKESLKLRLVHNTKDLNELKKNHESNTQELSIIKPKAEYLEREKVRLEEELKVTSEKLTIMLKAKNEAEALSDQVKNELEKCKECLKEKEKTASSQKIDLEQLMNKLSFVEQELVKEENKKEEIKKELEMVGKRLNNKIVYYEERLKLETESKNKLAVEILNVEKAHSNSKNELIRVQSEFKDIKAENESLKASFNSKDTVIKELKAINDSLIAKITSMEIKGDELRLEIGEKEELLNQLDVTYNAKLQAKKNKIEQVKQLLVLNREQYRSEYEDLYSKCYSLYQKLGEYMRKVLITIISSIMKQ